MFKLAELFVDISAKDDALKKSVGGLKGELSAMGVAIGTAVGNMAAAVVARATSAIANFFSQGVSGAAELQDVLQATSAIFGDSAGIITARADEMAAKFGTVKTEYIAAAQAFGAAFKGAGSPVADAAALGNQLAKLGMDMASFKGGTTSNAEAFTALQAALRGEFDPLERFNVFLTAAAIQQEAVSMGLIKSAKDMDEAAKKQATLSLIMKKTIDQQGDLDRTSDQTHNTWTKLTGSLTNLGQSIGSQLLPVLTQLAGAAGSMVASVSSAFEANKGVIAGWIDSAAAAWDTFSTGMMGVAKTAGPALLAIADFLLPHFRLLYEWRDTISSVVEAVGFTWRNFPKILEVAMLEAQQQLLNIQSYFQAFMANAGIIGDYIANNWRQLIVDAVNAVGTAFKNLTDNLGGLARSIAEFAANPTKGFHFAWKDLLTDFKPTADKLPEMVAAAFTDMGPIIRQKLDEIGKDELDRTDRLAKAAKDRAAMLTGGSSPAAKAAQQGAKKTADFKSEASSVSEFALKLRSSIYENGAEAPQVKEQRETNKRLDKANDNLDKMAKKAGVAVLG